jgi:hypothetical protein
LTQFLNCDSKVARNSNVKERRAKLNWDDYFSSLQKQRPKVTKDGSRYSRHGDELLPFQDQHETWKKAEMTRLVEGRPFMTYDDPAKHASYSNVPMGQLDSDKITATQKLFQGKMAASCKPAELGVRQNWGDMIERTLTTNDLLAGSVYSKSRLKNERLERTRGTIQPEMQLGDSTDPFGRKITSARRK